MSNVIPFQPGEEDAGLEPLGKYRAGLGLSSTMRSVFDVLYEAGEPLDIDTIAERTFGRASGAAQGWARRATLRQRERHSRRYKRSRESTLHTRAELSIQEAWRPWIANLVFNARRSGSLLRNDTGRYLPNPDKPPRVANADGKLFPYTREAWESTTVQERTVGEIHTMKMESERMLGSRSRDELLQVLEILVDGLAGFGKEKRRPLDPRTVRSQLRWLLERPTTDESRAWLLHELTRRIYEA